MKQPLPCNLTLTISPHPNTKAGPITLLQSLERVNEFKYLGVTLNECMNWKDHVESVCKKANNRLSLMTRIRSCLTPSASKCIYYTLIQSLMDYADTSLGSLSAGCIQDLQRVQNRGARLITQNSSSSIAISQLKWMNLETRRIMHQCTLIYRCLHNMVPDYLTKYFVLNKSIRERNTRQSNNIYLPKPNLEIFKKSFKYAGAYHFNTLPNDIKQSLSLNSFKIRIRNYFTDL